MFIFSSINLTQQQRRLTMSEPKVVRGKNCRVVYNTPKCGVIDCETHSQAVSIRVAALSLGRLAVEHKKDQGYQVILLNSQDKKKFLLKE